MSGSLSSSVFVSLSSPLPVHFVNSVHLPNFIFSHSRLQDKSPTTSMDPSSNHRTLVFLATGILSRTTQKIEILEKLLDVHG